MNDVFILYFLTFYLAWSLLFVPLFVKNTKKQLAKIVDDEKELTILNKIVDNFSWQRVLISYSLIKDKAKVKVLINQVDKNDKTIIKTSLILGQLFVSRSLLLLLLSMLLVPLLIIGVVGFGNIQNFINKLFAIEKSTIHAAH